MAKNCYIKILCKNKKVAGQFMIFFITNKELTHPPRKWMNTIGNITENEWNSYTTLIKILKI